LMAINNWIIDPIIINVLIINYNIYFIRIFRYSNASFDNLKANLG
jgi:hypothetical protein